MVSGAGSLVDFTREIGPTQSRLILIVWTLQTINSRYCALPRLVPPTSLSTKEADCLWNPRKKIKISELKCERSRGCARLNLITSFLQSVFITKLGETELEFELLLWKKYLNMYKQVFFLCVCSLQPKSPITFLKIKLSSWKTSSIFFLWYLYLIILWCQSLCKE